MANNNYFISIKLSLFFVLKSLYLFISFNIIEFFDIITYKLINKKKIIDI